MAYLPDAKRKSPSSTPDMDAQVITTVRLMERKGAYHVELLGVMEVFRTAPSGVLKLRPSDEQVQVPLWVWEPE